MKAYIKIVCFAVDYIHEKAQSGKHGSLKPEAVFSGKASF